MAKKKGRSSCDPWRACWKMVAKRNPNLLRSEVMKKASAIYKKGRGYSNCGKTKIRKSKRPCKRKRQNARDSCVRDSRGFMKCAKSFAADPRYEKEKWSSKLAHAGRGYNKLTGDCRKLKEDGMTLSDEYYYKGPGRKEMLKNMSIAQLKRTPEWRDLSQTVKKGLTKKFDILAAII